MLQKCGYWTQKWKKYHTFCHKSSEFIFDTSWSCDTNFQSLSWHATDGKTVNWDAKTKIHVNLLAQLFVIIVTISKLFASWKKRRMKWRKPNSRRSLCSIEKWEFWCSASVFLFLHLNVNIGETRVWANVFREQAINKRLNVIHKNWINYDLEKYHNGKSQRWNYEHMWIIRLPIFSVTVERVAFRFHGFIFVTIANICTFWREKEQYCHSKQRVTPK